MRLHPLLSLMKQHLPKAWTSQMPVAGYRHFQLVMQGGRGAARWVELAPVLAPSQRERVPWTDLMDRRRWASGWQQLPKDDENPPTE